MYYQLKKNLISTNSILNLLGLFLLIYLLSFKVLWSQSISNVIKDLKVADTSSRFYDKDNGKLTDFLASVELVWKGKILSDYKINGYRDNNQEKFYIAQFCPENNRGRCFEANYLWGFEQHISEMSEQERVKFSAKCFSLAYLYDEILEEIKKEVSSDEKIISDFYSSRENSYRGWEKDV